MLLTPSPCHKLSHFLAPPPPSSGTYFMDGPYRSNANDDYSHLCKLIMGHGGALVESIALNRRVVGSTPALAAT